ncbi:hypothetical protein [Bacillus mycoides]|uniref:Integron cassette protein domain-containing protein n=1 Tax=Bacillus mycoides TaxID=1405 RepID=A0A4V5TPS1_BACMY|nr:hypothetical protein [Bacillus mycoides]TKI80463.1 hypothetical protein FC701_28255 [Bacillus mycoides]
MNVELNAVQQEQRAVIETNLELVKQATNGQADPEHDQLFEQMADVAHELHMSLEPRPKHHQYMIENSGMQPEEAGFYRSIHAVEDLLAYLDNTDANNDPEDQTMGNSFEMQIYSRRWGHNDPYTLIRNEEGWRVSYMTYDWQSGKDALEVLIPSLRHDSIVYPYNLGDVMMDIWNQAAEDGLSHEEVQGMLNDVAEWINATEKTYPTFVR